MVKAGGATQAECSRAMNVNERVAAGRTPLTSTGKIARHENRFRASLGFFLILKAEKTPPEVFRSAGGKKTLMGTWPDLRILKGVARKKHGAHLIYPQGCALQV